MCVYHGYFSIYTCLVMKFTVPVPQAQLPRFMCARSLGWIERPHAVIDHLRSHSCDVASWHFSDTIAVINWHLTLVEGCENNDIWLEGLREASWRWWFFLNVIVVAVWIDNFCVTFCFSLHYSILVSITLCVYFKMSYR